jgi:hypothetical protein
MQVSSLSPRVSSSTAKASSEANARSGELALHLLLAPTFSGNKLEEALLKNVGKQLAKVGKDEWSTNASTTIQSTYTPGESFILKLVNKHPEIEMHYLSNFLRELEYYFRQKDFQNKAPELALNRWLNRRLASLGWVEAMPKKSGLQGLELQARFDTKPRDLTENQRDTLNVLGDSSPFEKDDSHKRPIIRLKSGSTAGFTFAPLTREEGEMSFSDAEEITKIAIRTRPFFVKSVDLLDPKRK